MTFSRSFKLGGTVSALVRVVAVCLATVICCGGRSVADEELAVSSVAIGGDETSTTISIDLSRSASVTVFGLADPNRLVVDLPAVRFDLAAGAGRTGRGLVSAWRFGAFAAGRSRLVFDLARPVKASGAELTAVGQGARVVVSIAAATGAEMRDFGSKVLGDAPTAVSSGSRDALRGAQPSTTESPAEKGRRIVVVDAGHGGVDAGTVSPATGTPEKTVVLAMAKVLARHLRETGRYTVRMTREEDVFVPLDTRVDIARAAKADLLVSVHADAEYDHSVRGATVYTVAEKASDARAAALAAKENRSDAIAGLIEDYRRDEVADILADLTKRESRRFSLSLANDILAEYARNGRLVKGAAHREAGLKVLRAHEFPSVLVEIGFLSNKEDEAQMTSTEWRERTAESLVSAIDRWFSTRGSAAAGAGGSGMH